jgi:hypothetical protein
MRDDFRRRLVAATPLICVIVYLFIGFYFNIWHPTWTIFLLIPCMPILLGLKKIIISYPLVCSIIYVVLGIFFDFWHPGWLIFLTIPVVWILFPTKNTNHKGKIHID